MEQSTVSRESLKCALAADVLRRFGELRLEVHGSSMLPSIRPGDILTVRRQGISDVRCGDVVLFAREGRLFAHRVMKKLEDRAGALLISRGDALLNEDLPVTTSELLGRVAFIHRGRSRIHARGWPSACGRLLAWLVGHSDSFARFFLHIHALRRRAANPLAREALVAQGLGSCGPLDI